MKSDGKKFLAELAVFAPNSFETTFARSAARLGLGTALSRAELILLYAAAYQATLCNIAFNGLGGCGGHIKAEHEPGRSRLEREFMAVRNQLFACAGWHNLPAARRSSVQRTFLRVEVNPDKLLDQGTTNR